MKKTNEKKDSLLQALKMTEKEGTEFNNKFAKIMTESILKKNKLSDIAIDVEKFYEKLNKKEKLLYHSMSVNHHLKSFQTFQMVKRVIKELK